MIADEAKKRGFAVSLTDNRFERCESGWYCEHVNFPQYSKFSVIMLHDITQQYGNWPDIWLREPWNKYDIGFLPSRVWTDNWDQCSQFYYANPRKGVYLTGWPKADRLIEFADQGKKARFRDSIGLDSSKPTILYAPAWENDGKQDEFVQAMMPLNVNILVKQAPWSDLYVEQIRNIAEMRELHRSNPRVIQLDPKTSILDAIMVSDILVSEESSTMCEAVMMGKPAVSVSNWLIPDTTPSRYPADDYDFVIKTKKEQLTECVSTVLKQYEKYAHEAQKYSDNHFANLGHCIPMMLDVLEAVAFEKETGIAPLTPRRRQSIPLKTLLFHKKEQFRRALVFNYSEQSKALKAMKGLYHQVKK